MSPYGALSALVIEATPPTRIAVLVTPGWSTVVFVPDPPPPLLSLPPPLEPDDALLHAVATTATAHSTTTRRRVREPRMHTPPGGPARAGWLTLTSGLARSQAGLTRTARNRATLHAWRPRSSSMPIPTTKPSRPAARWRGPRPRVTGSCLCARPRASS